MNVESEKMTYQDLKNIIASEKNIYFDDMTKIKEYRFRKNLKYEIYSYIESLRKYEYLCYKRDDSNNMITSKYYSALIKLCDRKKNNKGIKLGLEITPNRVKQGVKICHQNVIINGYVGKNCVFHGNNVVGNKSTGAKDEIPIIGNNVDVGVGAIIIGKVEIADNCVIGAGAVVTKSFLIPGTVITGVPAKAANTEG